MGILTRISGLANQLVALITGQQRYQSVSTNSNGNSSQTTGLFKGRFRSHKWDPRLIIGQMIAMQCLFYITMGLTIAILSAIGGYPVSLTAIFHPGKVHLSGRQSQIILIAHMMNSIFAALTLWFIVQRAKQCLDFTCTLHFYHLIFCWIYMRQFPTSVTWWLVQAACIILMVVIGEYLCFRTEMKAIPVIGSRADV